VWEPRDASTLFLSQLSCAGGPRMPDKKNREGDAV